MKSMSADASTLPRKNAVRLKAVVLPTEHGSWGFLGEPLLAAIIVAPSPAAFWLFILFAGAFLTRQPLKILLGDLINSRNLPQTKVAARFTAIFASIAAIGLIGAAYSANAFSFAPLALVMPFAIWQIYSDAHRKSRSLSAELLGAMAISSSSAAIALAAGWTAYSAVSLWAIFAVRLMTSIIYVRQRLLLEKQKSSSFFTVAVVNIAGFLTVAVLAFTGAIPALPAGFFAVLTARAIFGMSSHRRRAKATRIGIFEVLYGALLVAAVAIGYAFKI